MHAHLQGYMRLLIYAMSSTTLMLVNNSLITRTEGWQYDSYPSKVPQRVPDSLIPSQELPQHLVRCCRQSIHSPLWCSETVSRRRQAVSCPSRSESRGFSTPPRCHHSRNPTSSLSLNLEATCLVLRHPQKMEERSCCRALDLWQ